MLFFTERHFSTLPASFEMAATFIVWWYLGSKDSKFKSLIDQALIRGFLLTCSTDAFLFLFCQFLDDTQDLFARAKSLDPKFLQVSIFKRQKGLIVDFMLDKVG